MLSTFTQGAFGVLRFCLLPTKIPAQTLVDRSQRLVMQDPHVEKLTNHTNHVTCDLAGHWRKSPQPKDAKLPAAAAPTALAGRLRAAVPEPLASGNDKQNAFCQTVSLQKNRPNLW